MQSAAGIAECIFVVQELVSLKRRGSRGLRANLAPSTNPNRSDKIFPTSNIEGADYKRQSDYNEYYFYWPFQLVS